MATPAVSSRYRLFVRQSGELLEADGFARAQALAVRLARRQTKRLRVISVLPVDYSAEPDRSTVQVRTAAVSEFCRALADSEERVAAVIVHPDERDVKHKAFLREIRELTSAEGAWLIWHEPKAHVDGENEIPREFHGIRPDITCWRS